MNCSQQISHTIRPGDNLYQLARYYQTTVPGILSLNPNIDPYNLQVGSSVTVCPGERFVTQPGNPNPPACPNPSKQIDLIKSMRLAWLQHVYWTRMLIISIAERLKDQKEVTGRLLQNPDDLAAIFANYYSRDTAGKISQLLTEHLQIGAELITALRDGKTAEANALNGRWYANADKMAEAFSSINPFYDREELRKMLYTHLDLTRQEAAARLAGNYQSDIDAFGRVEKEVLTMADYFTSGLMGQFPNKFS